MSATATPLSAADTEYARRVAATVRGIGLIGVLKGFTRSVVGLGLAISDIAARLTHEGANPYSPNAGFDLSGAMQLLRRALHLADALRARLRTPAVIASMRRPRAARASIGSQSRPVPGTRALPGETMSRLLFLRRDGEFRRGWRQAIAEMSDREVLTHIYGGLLKAAAMLGETAMAARIERLAYAASALLADETDDAGTDDAETDEVGPDAATRRPADPTMADDGPRPGGAAGVAPPPHAGGRGPP